MSDFSFSHSVFKRPILQTCKNQGLFGKLLNHCLQNAFSLNKSQNFYGVVKIESNLLDAFEFHFSGLKF